MRASDELDLDVHTGREVVEPLERVDRLRRRLEDVDQALVRTDLEVLARVLVLERTADHAVAVLLRRQRDRACDCGAGTGGRLDDLTSCLLDRGGVVGLEPDADFVLGESCHGGPFDARRGGLRDPPQPCATTCYSITSVTTPEPTVRPPSRMAKRRPWSMAIGW